MMAVASHDTHITIFLARSKSEVSRRATKLNVERRPESEKVVMPNGLAACNFPLMSHLS